MKGPLAFQLYINIILHEAAQLAYTSVLMDYICSLCSL